MKREKIKEGTYITRRINYIKDLGYLQILRYKKISSDFYREYEYSFDICESVSLTKGLKGAEIDIHKKDYIYSAAVEEPFAKRSTSNEIFFLTIYQLKYKKDYREKIFFDQL